MPSKPSVSVIIPAHNCSAFVGRAVASVVTQEFGDWEAIVIDDASTDDTWAACNALEPDPRVHLLQNPENLGTAGTRNRGLAAARGNYIALLDSDDRWYPNFLSTQLQVLNSRPEVHCVCSDFDLINEHDVITFASSARFSYDPSHPLQHHNLASLWNSSGNVIPSTFVAERDVFEMVGGFQKGYFEDVNFWLRLGAAGFDIFETPAVLASYRLHSGQKTKNAERMRVARAEAYRTFVAADPQAVRRIPRESVRKKLHELYASAGDVHFWMDHDYEAASRYYRLALRQSPFDLGTAVKLTWSHTPEVVRRAVRGFRQALTHQGKPQ
ncbi:MAG: glycosyltransferase family 2 protein [Steroidobacteraceae bacterium]|nr:glycosyltransferase family 2 protein [Steroidobacteraceae bacterium]